MKNFINCFKYLLICVSTALMICCFVFTLFFGIASLSALVQASFLQIVALFSFFITFGMIGDSFMLVAERLYKSTRS